MYRGYCVRHTHKKLLSEKRAPLRSAKALIIQCQMRRYLGLKHAQEWRAIATAAVLLLQRVYRGFVVRNWLRRDRAARVLQRACKMFKDRRFFSLVMMMVHLRKIFQRRIVAATNIQKIIRAYLAKIHLAKRRRMVLLRFHHAARILQKCFCSLMQYRAEQRRLAVSLVTFLSHSYDNNFDDCR
jgi:hypothetical protein